MYCYNGYFPIEISFEEYSLSGTSCEWKNSATYIQLPQSVDIVDCNEDLERYFECVGDDMYPLIDFSKRTLVIAHGIASSPVKVNCNSLQQFSEQNYRMELYVKVGIAAVQTHWQVPIIVEKLNEQSIIELIITIK